MTTTEVQLPDPLFRRLQEIAEARDWPFGELIRRGLESYAQTFPKTVDRREEWTMPVLPRGSGGHLVDPSTVSPEAEAIEARFLQG